MKKRGVFFHNCTINVLLVLIITLLFFSQVFAAATYPKPTDSKYINDYTSTIDESTKNYIISVGKELEDKTGAQEIVVIVDSLQESDIQSYANELFRTWGIGQKDKNNGLLILLSMKDREWKVEVGTGLEGAITDIYSARVMDGVAAPKFKEGNYSAGIKESYSIFADSIAKEYNITLDKNEKISFQVQDTSSSNSKTGIVFGIIIIIFVILDFIFNRGRITSFFISIAFLFGRGGGGGNNGGGSSGGGGFGGMGGGSSSGGGSSGRF